MLLLDGLQGLYSRRTLVCALKVPDEHGPKLVPCVDRSFRQVDDPRSGRIGQCRGQIVGLHLIISSCGLDDCLIDLDEFFRIAGPIIIVNVPSLELVWPYDIPKWCR
jgi:hypothetical protein